MQYQFNFEFASDLAQEFTSLANDTGTDLQELAEDLLGASPADELDPTIYEYLSELKPGMVEKLITQALAGRLRIAGRTFKLPSHLWEDAEGAILLAFCTRRKRAHFTTQQTVRYAQLVARHAAMEVRRTQGCVVELPKTIFKLGAKTKLAQELLENMGSFENPFDIDGPQTEELAAEEYENFDSPVDPAWLRKRLARLIMSDTEQAVVKLVLVERKTAQQAADVLEITGAYATKIVNRITNALYAQDAAFDQRLAA